MSGNVGETPRWRQELFAGRRIETAAVCVLCLQPSSRSVCDGCESTGGLFGDWRSDCGEGS